jgi:hypothetical protein
MKTYRTILRPIPIFAVLVVFGALLLDITPADDPSNAAGVAIYGGFFLFSIGVVGILWAVFRKQRPPL